ncbi:MAG: hypothetical protein WCV90_00950 [Candidatus Woesearchaeota archaeon]
MIFDQILEGKIDSDFFRLVRQAEEVKYLSYGISQSPTFSTGYLNCVGVVLLGETLTALSHYDLIGEEIHPDKVWPKLIDQLKERELASH